MPISENLIALGGLITANLSLILSIILAKSSRKEPFKKAFYDQQMKATLDCADALVATQMAIDNFLLSTEERLLDFNMPRAQFIEAIQHEKDKLRIAILRYSPYLPTEIFATLSEYLAFLELVTGEMKTHEGFTSIGRNNQQIEPWEDFYANFALAILSIRKFLGVGPLTSSIARTVGTKDRRPVTEDKNAREIIRLLQRTTTYPHPIDSALIKTQREMVPNISFLDLLCA